MSDKLMSFSSAEKKRKKKAEEGLVSFSEAGNLFANDQKNNNFHGDQHYVDAIARKESGTSVPAPISMPSQEEQTQNALLKAAAKVASNDAARKGAMAGALGTAALVNPMSMLPVAGMAAKTKAASYVNDSINKKANKGISEEEYNKQVEERIKSYDAPLAMKKEENTDATLPDIKVGKKEDVKQGSIFNEAVGNASDSVTAPDFNSMIEAQTESKKEADAKQLENNNEKISDLMSAYIDAKEEYENQKKEASEGAVGTLTYDAKKEQAAKATMDEIKAKFDMAGYSKKEFEQIEDDLTRVKNAKREEENKQVQQQMVNDGHHGAANTLGTFSGVFGGIPAAAYDVSQAMQGKRIDPNSPYRSLQNAVENIDEAELESISDSVTKNVGKENSWQESLAKYGYNIAMAGERSLVAAGIGATATSAIGVEGKAAKAINNLITLPMFGTSAFDSTVKEGYERGLNDQQIYTLATAAGTAEMLTEMVSLDYAWDVAKRQGKAATRSALMNMLVENGIEGSEEVASDLINELADRLVAGDQSKYNENIAFYQSAEGGSHSLEEAKTLATKDFFTQVGLDFVAGTLSGLPRSVGANVVSSASQAVDDTRLGDYASKNEGTENRISDNRAAYLSDKAHTNALSAIEKVSGLNEKSNVFEKHSAGKAMRQAMMDAAEANQASQIPSEYRTAKTTEAQTVEAIRKATTPHELAVALESAIRETSAIKEASVLKEKQLKAHNFTDDDIKNALTVESMYEKSLSGETFTEEQINTLPEAERERATKAVKTGSNRYIIQNDRNAILDTKTEKAASVDFSEGIKKEGNQYLITDTDGQTHALNEIEYSRASVLADAISYVKKTASPEIGTAIFEFVAANQDATVVDIKNGIKNIYQAARTGISFEAFKKNHSGISLKNVDTLYNAIASNTDTKDSSKKLTTAKKSGGKLLIDKSSEKETRAALKNMSKIQKNFMLMMAKRLGVDFELFNDTDNKTRGSYDPEHGKIRINLAYEKKIYTIALHEGIGEFMQAYNSDGYNQVATKVIEYFYAQNSTLLSAEVDFYLNAYRSDGQVSKNERDAANEFVNDTLAKIFSTDENIEKFIMWLKANDPDFKKTSNVFVRYFEAIKAWLKDVLKHNVLDESDKLDITKDIDFCDKIAAEFLKEADKAIKNRDKAAGNAKEVVSNEMFSNSRKSVSVDVPKFSFSAEDAFNDDKMDIVEAEEKNIKDFYKDLVNSPNFIGMEFKNDKLYYMLTKSVKTDGLWQLTTFIEKDMEALSDSQYLMEGKKAKSNYAIGAADKLYSDLSNLISFENDNPDVIAHYDNQSIDARKSLDVEEKAKEHFGTTENFREAGYLLTDGTMLDFSGAHWLEGESPEYIANWKKQNDIRQVDHEDIYEVLEKSGDNRKQFIEMGAIRLVPEASGINLSTKVEPTSAQYRMIKEYVRTIKNDPHYQEIFRVDLEADKPSPNKIVYEGGELNEDRIVNDLKSFYENGTIPKTSGMQQFRKSIAVDSEGRELTVDQIEYFKDSKVVDDNGNLKIVYHGTDSDFTVFDKSKIGQNFIQSLEGGFFFTDNKRSASSYGSNLMKVYLNLKNPLVLDYRNNDFYYNASEVYDMQRENILEDAEFNENDGIIINHNNGSLYVAFESNQIKLTSNEHPTDDNDIRKSIHVNMFDHDRYNALKDQTIDIPISDVVIHEAFRDRLSALESMSKADAKKAILNIVEKINPSVIHKYSSDDIDFEFDFSNKKTKESIVRQQKDVSMPNKYIKFYKLMKMANDVVKNAKLVMTHTENQYLKWKEHKRKDAVGQTNVLVSAFIDEDGINPVKITIMEYVDKNRIPKMHVIMALPEVIKNSNKKTEVAEKGKDKAFADSRSVFNYNLSRLLENIKNNPNSDTLGVYIPYEFATKRKDAPTYFIDGDPDINDSSVRKSLDVDSEYMELAKDPEKNESKLNEMVREAATNAGYDSELLYHGGGVGYHVFESHTGLFFFTPEKETADTYARRGNAGSTRAFYGKTKNMAVLNAMGNSYMNVPIVDWMYRNHPEYTDGVEDYTFYDSDSYSALDAADIIRLTGDYDGLKITNVNDSAYGVHPNNTDYIYFKNTDFKSADPVTYDDDGNIIPLSERFNPNEKDIRKSLDVGYHAGDLGKSEGIWNMLSSNRGTGHFGTGTYFVGDKEKIDGYNSRNGVPAPVESVDFEKYNLFKPLSEKDGFDLHSNLKFVNDNILRYPDLIMDFDQRYAIKKDLDNLAYTLSWNDSASKEEKANALKKLKDYESKYLKYLSLRIQSKLKDAKERWSEEEYYSEFGSYADNIYEELSDLSKEYDNALFSLSIVLSKNEKLKNMSFEGRKKYLDNVISDIYNQIKDMNISNNKYKDSPSTRLMKALGYEGVDVRNFRGLDNTAYGSVIYDLKGEDLARKQQIGTARFSLNVPDESSPYWDTYKQVSTVTRLMDSIKDAAVSAKKFTSKDIDALKFDLVGTYNMSLDVAALKEMYSDIETFDKYMRSNDVSNQVAFDYAMQIADQVREKAHYFAGGADIDNDVVIAMHFVTSYLEKLTKNVTGDTTKKKLENTKKVESSVTEITHQFETYKAKLDSDFKQQVSALEKKYEAAEKRSTGQSTLSIQAQREITKRAEREAKKKLQSLKETEEKAKQRDAITRTCTRLIDWMDHPTNERHVPDFMKSPLTDMIQAIDFMPSSLRKDPAATTKSAEKWQTTMARLNKVIEDIKNVGEANIDSSETERQQKYALSLVMEAENLFNEMSMFVETNAGVVSLTNLSAEEMKKLHKFMSAISSAINKMNSLYKNRNYENIKKLATDSMDEMRSLKPVFNDTKIPAKDVMHNFLNVEMLEPISYFEELGSAASSVMTEFFDGEKTGIEMIKEAEQFFSDLHANMGISEKDTNAWSREIHELEGITLTTSDIMSLYASEKREKLAQEKDPETATYHVAAGGYRGYKHKIGNRIINNNPRTLHNNYGSIIDLLTDQQKEYADRVVEYMSTTLSAHGNKTSQALYGYDKFTGSYYFPIKTDTNRQDTRESNAGTAQASMRNIINASFTKTQLDRSDSALVIHDFFDVVTEHIMGMANYCSYAEAISDALRWFNYAEVVRTHDKDQYGAAERNRWIAVDKSVKMYIENAKGTKGKNYFEQFLRDLNLDNKSQGSEILTKLIGMYKAQAVAGNLRVVIQQPAAMTRALDVIEHKYLLKGIAKMLKNPKKAVEYATKESYLCYWKSKGFSDTRISQGMKEIITGNATKMQDIVEKTGALAGWADDVSWAAMYAACEAKVDATKPSLEKGSEKYKAAVDDIFSDVVNHTQVIDSTLRKTEQNRNKDLLQRTANAFKNEPQKTYNMLHRKLYAYQQAVHRKKGIDKALKALLKTLTVYGYSAIITGIAQSIADAFRDDSDDTWLEKFLTALLPVESAKAIMDAFDKGEFSPQVMQQVYAGMGNILDNANPLTLMPYISEIDSLIKGFESTRMDTAAFVQIGDTIKKLTNDSATVYGKIYSLSKAISMLTGAPFSNVLREFKVINNNFLKDYVPYGKLYTSNSVKDKAIKSGYTKPIDDAFASGDLANIRTSVSNYVQYKYDEKIKEGVDPIEAKKDANTAVKTYITNTYKDELKNLYFGYLDGKNSIDEVTALKNKMIEAYAAAGADRADQLKTIQGGTNKNGSHHDGWIDEWKKEYR